MRKTIYSSITADDAKKMQHELKELDAKIKATAETGKKCLAHPDFKKYMDEHVKCREALIRIMKEHVSSDPVQDAFFLRACLAKIIVLDMLVETIEKDAKRAI